MQVKMTADFGKVGHALGVVDGISESFDTPLYISDVVRAASDYAAQSMGEKIDRLALTDSKLSHVYEWRTPGIPTGRLFNIYSKGNGSTRVVTFNFKASKTPIPNVSELEAAGKILPVPAEIKARLKNRNYIFRQKAQMMEYGGVARIRPLGPNKKIFIPFSEKRNGRTYAFVDQARVSFAGRKNRGMFHAAFKLASIQTRAETSRFVEKAVTDTTNELGLRAGKTSAKTLNIGFSQGQDYSKNRMKLSGKMMNAQIKRAGTL